MSVQILNEFLAFYILLSPFILFGDRRLRNA